MTAILKIRPPKNLNVGNGATDEISPWLLVAVGFLDVSTILSYVFSVNNANWYVGILAVKLIFLAMSARRISISGRSMIFLGAVIFGVLPGTLMNSYVGDGMIRIFGFCAQIFLTATLVGPTGLTLYLRSTAIFIAISAAIHSALCVLGIMPDQYGRFLYFGNSSPNLGAEIGAVGVLAAAMTLSWRNLILISSPIISSVLFLQGRSALLAIILILTIRFIQSVFAIGRRTPLLTLAVAVAFSAGVSTFMVLFGRLTGGLSELFMLNNQYRGLGTGFVGRDERWAHAYELFTQRYVFGVGASYFESRAEFGPHNYFLYGLTTMGIVGFVVFFTVLIYNYSKMFRSDRDSAMIFLGIFPLLMFNDRMLNLNPYPFMIYIILLCFPAIALARKYPKQSYSKRKGIRGFRLSSANAPQ